MTHRGKIQLLRFLLFLLHIHGKFHAVLSALVLNDGVLDPIGGFEQRIPIGPFNEFTFLQL